MREHSHQRIAVSMWCPECGQELGQYILNRADIEPQEIVELPGRDDLSLLNVHLATPVAMALALNVLSDGSIGAAMGAPRVPIAQGT